mgnify:CR=1 FL=1
MHDIRLIRDNPEAFDAGMARRGLSALSGEILSLDEARRTAILAAETAQAEANKAAKSGGAMCWLSRISWIRAIRCLRCRSI